MKKYIALAALLLTLATPAITQNIFGPPIPPPGATVFSNIDQRGGWGSCNAANCAGGSGHGTYWMAQNQGSPSRDGASTEFYIDGAWDDGLWYNKLGAHNDAHNLLWDFYFLVDNNSRTAAQALEFDAFQFIGGYNYMIGSQCNYAAGVWDTWDEATGRWIHSPVACVQFTPNVWHHVVWYVTTDAAKHQYTYVTLYVDGRAYPMHITGNAKNNGWGDNMGVQWQLDVNGTGVGYSEWIDNATLTVW